MEIIAGIHVVPGIFLSRVYLIEDDALALVDSGLPWNARTVLRYIRSIGRRPEELRWILMTHSHPDHTAGALGVSRRTGAQIVAHADDTKTHSNQEVSLTYMGVFTSLRLPLPFLQRTCVDRVVDDGHVLPLMGGTTVLHTPGHTPGSVAYLLESKSVLFSGDTVFSDGRRVSRSIPYFGHNDQEYRESLQKLASVEFDTLCGGHGAPLVGGASDRLRELLRAKPDPPTWRGFLTSLPRRLYCARGITGEEY